MFRLFRLLALCLVTTLLGSCVHRLPYHPNMPPLEVRDENFWSTNLGKVISVNDDRCSFDNGQVGYWNPQKFIDDGIGGLFMLEEFSTGKIPVVLIHGGLGHCGEWEAIAKVLQPRFQIWLYFYPSGQSIDRNALSLNRALSELRREYPFPRVHLVAHSLGGLVAQSAINQRDGKLDGVFVSIATPWNGHPRDIMQLKDLPTHIPSWRDMRPDSIFLEKMHRKARNSPDMYLIYGYRGGSKVLAENNDGVLSLATLLDRRAQGRARKVIALNENHTSILQSKETLEVLQELLPY